MFLQHLSLCFLAAILCLSDVEAHNHCDQRLSRRDGGQSAGNYSNSEDNKVLDSQSLFVRPKGYPEIPLVTVPIADGRLIDTNTTTVANVQTTAVTVLADAVDSTALVIARSSTEAYSAYSGLNDRGIPYQVLVVPQTGEELPVLNSTSTHGNFGMIVVLGEVSYDYVTSGYASALTDAQWQQLYTYQVAFGIRMVRLDVNPGPSTGTMSLGSCCTGEQYVYISNATAFPGAGLKTGLAAGVSTSGLYHYPAQITDSSIATEFLAFAAASSAADQDFSSISTAGVINYIAGRQQMVFFLPFATDWSETSVFLQASWIHWATRGLYAGYRRLNLNTQIDDMFLITPMFDTGANFRTAPLDVYHHIEVMTTVNANLKVSNPGSAWIIELGHNGNGNIEQSSYYTTRGAELCGIGPVEYPDQIDTPLEFQKPLGTGKNLYPVNLPVTYPNYTAACMQSDTLLTFWQTTAYRNKFAHISHTFSHEDEDNATYSDVYKELTWNQGWLKATGFDQALNWSSLGIIPPAITGLHNGDALRAWADAGIQYVVGDNTRPVLLNPENEHWPLITNVSENGYSGIQVAPRWATNIYYNCDLAACVVAEYANLTLEVESIEELLANEVAVNSRHLLGLHHDPFMFHQANLRYEGADSFTVGTTTAIMSLFEVWVKLVTNEVSRLVTWPIISQKHDDFSVAFQNRMTRDDCNYNLSWSVNPSFGEITTVTVTSDGDTCAAPIPVTVPGTVTDLQGFTTEQIGDDPLTIWVILTGEPVTFTLTAPLVL